MRKKFLALLMATTMVVSLAACGGGSTTTPTPSQAPATPTPTATSTPIPVEEMKFTQAPTIQSTVPVADRLPVKDDIFIESKDASGQALEIGVYCGNLHWSHGGGSWDISRPMLETIVHYNVDGTYYPNVIKDFKANDTYTEWTFTLRKGMKWSDGEPFTSADIEFWYEKCHKNNWDGKASWTALKDSGSEDGFARLEVVDETTVIWHFVNPKYPGDFIENGDFKFCWAPKHFLEDMIGESYGGSISDEQALINAQNKGINYSSVKDLGKNCVYYFWNTAGLPTLNPWVLTTQEGLNNRSETCQLIRNEFYWKVDAQGQQLPYYDKLDMIKYGDDQAKLEFLSGDLDHLEIGMEAIGQMIKDCQESKTNPFTPVLGVDASTSWGSEQMTFNYTIEDEKYAALFNNIKFRQAVSVSVDRETISGLITDGFLKGSQAAPSKDDVDYNAEWAAKWTEYNAQLAKDLLAECGLVMGADGYYDFADGTDLQIDFFGYDTSDNAARNFGYYQKYFTEAGLKTTFTAYEVALFDAKIDGNEWMAVYGPHTSVGGKMVDRPAPLVPISGAGGAEWYGNYGYYYEWSHEKDPEKQAGMIKGTEPTGDMAKLVELYEEWLAAPSAAERSAIELKIQKVHQDNVWTIAFLESVPTYTLVNSKLHNYPVKAISIDKYMYSNIKHPWTFFDK